jgi:DNA-directed RNA polymerase subunit M/transcription elongation factor TFIIS
MKTFTQPPRICPRCSGLLYPDYDGDLCCLACGEVLYCTPAYEPLLQLPPARTAAQLRTRDYNRNYQRQRRARRQRSA